MRNVRHIILTLILTSCLPLAAGAKDFEQRVPAEPGGHLRIDLRGGAIVVESHSADEVRVDALAAGVGAPSLDLELSSNGDEVTLRGGARDWFSGLLGTHVRVRVRLPREFSIDARTRGGSIEIEDIEGEVKTRTSGGSIRVGRIEGDVETGDQRRASWQAQPDRWLRCAPARRGGPSACVDVDRRSRCPDQRRTHRGPRRRRQTSRPAPAVDRIRVRYVEAAEGRTRDFRRRHR